jgi:L-ascorbate metabolism protein UlaG (beta-lactamase superfamily)
MTRYNGLASLLVLTSPGLAVDPRPVLPAASPPAEASGMEMLYAWSTYAADNALRSYRATMRETLQHRAGLMALDEALRFDNPDASTSPAVQGMLKRCLDAAAYEMEHTIVTENAVIWKLYEHGFVVRTSSFTVAFDIVRGWVADDAEINSLTSRIINQCDALFVSNAYAEHADTWVRDAFLAQSKPVIAPPAVWPTDGRVIRLARDGVTLHTVQCPAGHNLQVIMYPGRCGSDENNIPLVVAPGGLKFSHAGDQDNSAGFAWIDVIKNTHDVAFVMVNTAPAQRDRLVRGFDPRLAVTGHENDMTLSTTSRLGYFLSHDRLRQAGYPLSVLAWGDSLYYDPGQLTAPSLAAPSPAAPAAPVGQNSSARESAAADPRPTPLAPPALSVVDPDRVYDWPGYRERQHEYAYHAVDSLVRTVRPTWPELPERMAAMLALDGALHWDDSNGSAMSQFYNRRLGAALYEMDNTHITTGAVVWKLYNHGFIARTASVTIAFDLVAFYTSHSTMTEFINRSDVLFISHWHGDHNETWITDLFRAQGKPVITPHGLTPDGTTQHTVNLSGGRQLKVVMYPGYQKDVPDSVPIIFTPEGISFSHTGDLYQGGSTPINMWTWIDVVKSHWTVDILMINNFATDFQRVVRGFNPKVVIPGHENEISAHAVSDRKPWYLDYSRIDGLANPSVVMTWGESYFYPGGTVVNVPPTIVRSSISSGTLLADNATQYTVSLTASDPDGPEDIADMRIMLLSRDVIASENGRGYLAWGQSDGDVSHYGGTWTLAGDAVGGGRWGWRADAYGSDTYITPVSCSTSRSGSERTVVFTFTVKPAWMRSYNQTLDAFARDTGGQNTGWLPTSVLYNVPGIPGDFDHDDDVDQEDFGRFQACFTGPGVEQSLPGCADARLDADPDVDADDLVLFRRCMHGPNAPVSVNCAY